MPASSTPPTTPLYHWQCPDAVSPVHEMCHSSVPCLRLPCSLCATVVTSAPLAPDFLPMPLALFYFTWTWTKSWGLDPFSFPCISSQGRQDHPPAWAGLSRSALTLCVPTYPWMRAGIPEWKDRFLPLPQLLDSQPPNRTENKTPVLPLVLNFHHLGEGHPRVGASTRELDFGLDLHHPCPTAGPQQVSSCCL